MAADSTPKPMYPPLARPDARILQAKQEKDRRLGRGLSSLISSSTPPATPAAPAAQPHPPEAAPPHGTLSNIAVGAIEPNPLQPRRQFDDASLRALAESIKANGLVQPILVRRKRDGAGAAPGAPGFQLVAGERRWRAAQLAGLETMPAVIKHVAEDAMLEVALTENLHRADLNPIERGNAYLGLIKTRGFTQEILAQRLGENRASVANYLRMIDLHPDVQDMIAAAKLTFGHAKAVLVLTKPENQLLFAEAIIAKDWSVREAERQVAPVSTHPELEGTWSKSLRAELEAPDTKTAPPAEPKPKSANVLALEEKLTSRLGTRVAIHESRRPQIGKVVIDYYCLDDFDRIMNALGIERD
ncbi:MAG: ParB/RepB/Spo0J family partition protein [Phycisphaerae bacterium]|nr:ParB/RepB/Spo0J family partition protein [Phycisphaerae bacterium]